MSILSDHINETKAAEAFSRQSKVFDDLYGEDPIIQYKRNRVRRHMLSYLKPGSQLLELNCGSGEDAIFFAENDFKVHATDIAQGMLQVLQQKQNRHYASNRISFENCSFTQLEFLKNKGPYDHIYSNFGGLNCTGQLDKVLASFNALLKPGGSFTLVIISKFCFWEFLLLFKGKFRTAFRRFFSAGGRSANVEGRQFKCWYYKPHFIISTLKKDYELLGLESLCSIVPPSYMQHFAQKHPGLFSFLCKKENRFKSYWPWKYWGDYFIITMKKK